MNELIQNQIEELLLLALEREISEEQVQTLNRLIKDKPERIQYVVKYLQVFSALRFSKKINMSGYQSPDTAFCNPSKDFLLLLAENEKNAPPIEPKHEKDEIETGKSKIRRRRKPLSNKERFFFLIKAAAVVLIAMSVVLLDRWLGQIVQIRKERFVARISRAVDAQWLEVSGRIDVGSALYAGPLTLKKGIAEIVLDSGVRLLLEAPVELDLESDSRIYLEMGRLVANIEQSSEDRFVVRTANSTVVDYGTKFGVEVDQSGTTYAQVFQGKIEMRQGSDPLKYEKKLPLQSGQAGLVERSGELRQANVKAKRFITIIPSRYELAVKKTRPRYYWRFDRDQAGLIQDEMGIGLNKDYKLYGSLHYTDGPNLGTGKNIALRLTGREEDYAILRHCNPGVDNAGSFSMAMWIYPERQSAETENVTIVHIRKEDSMGLGNQCKLEFNNNEKFDFIVYCPDETVGRVRATSNEINQWYHVVVTYTDNDRISLYINGQLEASKNLPGAVYKMNLNVTDPFWCLGSGVPEEGKNNPMQKGRSVNGSFKGSVDEISHYNRELSADEVWMLYEAGRQ